VRNDIHTVEEVKLKYRNTMATRCLIDIIKKDIDVLEQLDVVEERITDARESAKAELWEIMDRAFVELAFQKATQTNFNNLHKGTQKCSTT